MRLTCMFSFILLFGAAGLVVFIHLQDPEEIVHQQTPGIKYNMGFQQPKKDCISSNNQDGRLRRNTADGVATVKLSGSLHLSENAPTKLQSTDRRQSSIMFVMKEHQQKVNSSTHSLPTLKSEDRNNKWKSLHQIQTERKRIMRETCSKYKSNNRRIITPYHVSRIFVEDKYRVLYCEVPKAGCSNWKRVLMVLNGLASSTKDIQHNTVHYGNYLKRLDGFDRKGIYHRLNTYTKMLFIREPFEKLVSAFRDKFEHPNNYYHPVFGKAIISRYRVNATKEALRTGSGVKFKEFIQYLLDVHRPVGMDIHWDHVNRLCSPCLIDYDFVGKFESMEDDANFFLHLIGAPQNLTFPKFKDRHSNEERTTTKITQHYFAQLSPSQRQRSYDFYYMDYLMFNYSKPFEDLY
ncbi:carbohydrate sulfotransferase 8 isoform X2 [Struthio camelus]|uniref:carbohydrate sulfotransferase 8 isoform X2 n=1 Tax=Struthio camelus TaxID=8801 RepID=UPI00051E6474|nr:PREDICTED: carbohydrate sulfotransferase 8 isoform X2 [Struthio camelus australis]